MTILIKVGNEYINPEYIITIREASRFSGIGAEIVFNSGTGSSVPYSLWWKDTTVAKLVKWLQTGERIVFGEVTVNSDDLR